jgi:ankyrin repeat protein
MVWRSLIIGGCFLFSSYIDGSESQPNSARTPPLSAHDSSSITGRCINGHEIHDTIEYTSVPTIKDCFCDEHEFHCSACCCCLDVQKVKLCLRCGYRNSNFTDIFSDTHFTYPSPQEMALITAVFFGELGKAAELLRADVNPNCRIFGFRYNNTILNTGQTPLHIASQAADERMVEILLKCPQTDPTPLALDGSTTIHELLSGIVDGNVGNSVRLRILIKILERGGKSGLHGSLKPPPLNRALTTYFGREHIIPEFLKWPITINHANPLEICSQLLARFCDKKSTESVSARAKNSDEVKKILALIETLKSAGARALNGNIPHQISSLLPRAVSPRLASPASSRPRTLSKLTRSEELPSSTPAGDTTRPAPFGPPTKSSSRQNSPKDLPEELFSIPLTPEHSLTSAESTVQTQKVTPIPAPTGIPILQLQFLAGHVIRAESEAHRSSPAASAPQSPQSSTPKSPQREPGKECTLHELFAYTRIKENRCLHSEHCKWCCPDTTHISIAQCWHCNYCFPRQKKLYENPTEDQRKFIIASLLGQIDTVKKYLDQNGNPNATAFGIEVETAGKKIILNQGETALMAACRAAQLEVVRLLLGERVPTDVNALSLTRTNAVQEAVNCIIVDGNTICSDPIQKILGLLFERNANAETHPKGGPTPLVQALKTEEGRLKLVPFLLQSGRARIAHQNAQSHFKKDTIFNETTNMSEVLHGFSPRSAPELLGSDIPLSPAATSHLIGSPKSRTTAVTTAGRTSPVTTPHSAEGSPRSTHTTTRARSNSKTLLERLQPMVDSLTNIVSPRTTQPNARTESPPAPPPELRTTLAETDSAAQQSYTDYTIIKKGKEKEINGKKK